MAKISFEIKGKEVQMDDMNDILDILFLKHLHNEIKNCVGSVCCQKHDQEPAVTIKGHNLDNLVCEVTGCCNELIKETLKKLNRSKALRSL